MITTDREPGAVRTVERAPTARHARHRRSRRRRFFASAWLWIPLICAVQIAFALRQGLNSNAFEDEGLYVYTGHRMIEHLLHGTFLPGYPGAYLSGAPGLYPVIAAMADAVGGLAAARDVSLAFAVLATVSTYGIGARLFGKAAGIIGAASFVLCGSVIYISHFATYDSMMMGLVAAAAWLAIRSAQRDGFAWAPAVSLLLTLAFLAKYAGGVYAPIVIALAVVVGWPLFGWRVVRRGIFAAAAALIMGFAVIELWGGSMIPGIESTTSSRIVLEHASASFLAEEIAIWVGPWLLLALLGALFRVRRQWILVGLLLVGSVIGPLDQLRIGEATSLSKHVAFGMVFAAPLIGDLFARGLQRHGGARALSAAGMLAVFAVLAASGLHYSHKFLTNWVNDEPLRPVLQRALTNHPGLKILGERDAPQRYEFEYESAANQWYDTYYLSYGGEIGKPAYTKALQQQYFGLIYLDRTTPFGSYIHDYLQSHPGLYHLVARPSRLWHGETVGHWSVYEPTGKKG